MSLFIGLASSSVYAQGPCKELLAPPMSSDLTRYEAWQVRYLKPTRNISDFQPQQGIFVTQRDAEGNPLEAKIRVLSDNAGSQIQVIGEFNDWGRGLTDADRLHPVAGTPYFEGTVRKLWHGMKYRLLVNGQSLIDPAAERFTSAEEGPYLNSVFWDFDGHDRVHQQIPVVDLRGDPQIIAETELHALVRKWHAFGHIGPDGLADTYRFITYSGVIQKLKAMGYNAIEFLPFATSVDGGEWSFRYQVYGLFAPDARYGTPKDFAEMIQAFSRAGIAVIMDAVVGHYPSTGNQGSRSLGSSGLHQWKKSDGRLLYGSHQSPWGTLRYDYRNPFVRRFLIDSILNMIKRYGISGVRFDNIDGIRFEEGGEEFLKELVHDIREYRPEMLLIGEMFFGESRVVQSTQQGGMGINLRTDSDFFDFVKDNLRQFTENLNLDQLRNALRNIWGWKEASRIKYITNHDEAANGRDGATGQYIASLLQGGEWSHVERKTKLFGALPLLTSSASIDMPQMRLLQEGTFTSNPGIQWEVEGSPSQRGVNEFFTRLSNYVLANPAFSFANLHPNIENHYDSANKVMSFLRIDRMTGKRIYAIANFSHQEISNYRFGVDTDQALRVVLDSARREFGGNGRLSDAAGDRPLQVDGYGMHGKSHAVTIPILPEWGIVVIETGP